MRGRRDPEIRIAIPENSCVNYKSSTGVKWVEIFIPPEDIADYDKLWGSMMVEPAQVDNTGRTCIYNIVRVNDNADIINSTKDPNQNRKLIATETLKPHEIIGRYLKYLRFIRFSADSSILSDDLNIASIALYKDMQAVGQDMLYYINRLPKYML